MTARTYASKQCWDSKGFPRVELAVEVANRFYWFCEPCFLHADRLGRVVEAARDYLRSRTGQSPADLSADPYTSWQREIDRTERALKDALAAFDSTEGR